MNNSYYKPGSWNVICQLCGRQFKSDEIRKRWDGLLVCANDYESRHSLDFIKVTPDKISVPYTSPEPADNFVPVIYIEASQGLADIGVADVAKADFKLTNIIL